MHTLPLTGFSRPGWFDPLRALRLPTCSNITPIPAHKSKSESWKSVSLDRIWTIEDLCNTAYLESTGSLVGQQGCLHHQGLSVSRLLDIP